MSGPQKRYWDANGHYEVAAARATLVLIVVILAMGLFIYVQSQRNNTLEAANAYLNDHRVMWAYMTADGTFASSDTRPKEMVSAFARQFLNDLYNYDPSAVKSNFDAALKMDDPIKAISDAENLKKDEATVSSNNLSSLFLIYQEKDLVEKDDTYIYECVARQRVETTNTLVNDTLYDVVLVLKKVPPTEARRAGLVVDGTPTVTPVNN
jgi:cbb3-type cytochrome oxidase subunit 3